MRRGETENSGGGGLEFSLFGDENECEISS